MVSSKVSFVQTIVINHSLTFVQTFWNGKCEKKCEQLFLKIILP